mgnify:CR=1 FL=1
MTGVSFLKRGIPEVTILITIKAGNVAIPGDAFLDVMFGKRLGGPLYDWLKSLLMVMNIYFLYANFNT